MLEVTAVSFQLTAATWQGHVAIRPSWRTICEGVPGIAVTYDTVADLYWCLSLMFYDKTVSLPIEPFLN
jgi:hypothetical protein